VVQTPEELADAYAAHLRETNALSAGMDGPAISRRLPLLQAYHAEAVDSILSVSGFVDRSGVSSVLRFAQKIMQQPRSLGTGVYFEEAPQKSDLARRLVAMCREVGYFGVFEAEFIQAGGHDLLIDFNPRYYGQMEFDVARGLPLPWLVQLASVGDEASLREAVLEAQAAGTRAELVYSDWVSFSSVQWAQSLLGKMSRSERMRWKRWRQNHVGRIVDASYAVDDQLPALFNLLQQCTGHLRHPRAFVRHRVLDR
jgi:D-aspartate ligase